MSVRLRRHWPTFAFNRCRANLESFRSGRTKYVESSRTKDTQSGCLDCMPGLMTDAASSTRSLTIANLSTIQSTVPTSS